MTITTGLPAVISGDSHRLRRTVRTFQQLVFHYLETWEDINHSSIIYHDKSLLCQKKDAVLQDRSTRIRQQVIIIPEYV
jgi:hypothetical protein